jgi:hypothetical protein
MADSESRDPVSQLQAAAARACCGAGMRWRTLVDSANQHRQAVQGSAVQLWGNLAHAVEERLKAHERMPMPALAVRPHLLLAAWWCAAAARLMRCMCAVSHGQGGEEASSAAGRRAGSGTAGHKVAAGRRASLHSGQQEE